MGTKIEYYKSPLAFSVDCNNFSLSGVDVWDHYQKNNYKGVTNNNQYKLQNPMDSRNRMLDRNNIESIKKTMQMHEDIFKHQVRELHRVYNVQKMLMDELKKEIKQNNIWTPMNNIGTNNPYFLQQQQQHQPTQISFGHIQRLKEDLHIKERSGSNSGEIMKRQRDFDLEKPIKSPTSDVIWPAAERDIFCRPSECDEVEALQSCKISNIDECDEEMEVDLTLCIGGSSSNNSKGKKKKKKKSSSYQLLPTRELNSYNVSFQSDRVVGDCSDPTTPISTSSVTFDQDKKGSLWFSQGLKLK